MEIAHASVEAETSPRASNKYPTIYCESNSVHVFLVDLAIFFVVILLAARPRKRILQSCPPPPLKTSKLLLTLR